MGTIGWAMALIAAANLAARVGFDGQEAGEERVIEGIKCCRCPPGKFTSGSPPDEPERRPGEDQIEVTFTRCSWAGKFRAYGGSYAALLREAVNRGKPSFRSIPKVSWAGLENRCCYCALRSDRRMALA